MYAIYLKVQFPDGEAQWFSLQEGAYVVGSDSAADVVLMAEGVAPRHVVLWVGATALEVECLVSGVRVNGKDGVGVVPSVWPACVEIAGVTLVVEQRGSRGEPEKPGDTRDAQPASQDSLAALQVLRPRGAGVALEGQRPQEGMGVPEKERETRQPAERPERGHDKAPLRGEYTLMKEIARGGMGLVFYAEDPVLKRSVAVKVSRRGEGERDATFQREAEVLAQLAHPNIVPVHAAGVDERGRAYYSMKLVKGQTLQAILHALQRGEEAVMREYSLSALLTVFRKVCDAMAYAHSKRILHRDLKPDNIMVGEYGEVLVMDWGLSKRLGAQGPVKESEASEAWGDGEELSQTMEGDLVGSPLYMSPEQASGKVGDLDERSDVYSLGAILFAILTLHPPVEGKGLREVIERVRSGKISEARLQGEPGGRSGEGPVYGRRVPEALQAVTRKALSLDRDARYATVRELSEDVQAYQNGFATRAEAAGFFRQLELFIKRHRAFSVGAALFLICGVGFVVELVSSERSAQLSARRAMEQAVKASLASAEAAEEAEDPEGMVRALVSIPEGHRDSIWHYLWHRLDSCDVRVGTRDGKSWIALEDDPSDPRRFVGLQSDGTLVSMDVETGEAVPLWKTDFKGRRVGRVAVSRDGEWIAIDYGKHGEAGTRREVEVLHLKTGKPVGPPLRLAPWRIYEMKLAMPLLVVVGVPPGPKTSPVECWDVSTGQLLWKRDDLYNVRFSADGRQVLGFSEGGVQHRLVATSGEAISASQLTSVHTVSNMRNAFWASPDGSDVISSNTDNLSYVKEAKGAPTFRIQVGANIHAVAALPKEQLFFIVLRRSEGGATLQWRSMVTGGVLKAFPLRGRLEWNVDLQTKLVVKPGVVGLLLDGAREVQLWRTHISKPLNEQTFPGSVGAVALENGDALMTLSRLDAMPGHGNSYRLEKRDWMPGGRGVKEVTGLMHDKSPWGLTLSTRESGDFFMYGHGNDDMVWAGSLDEEGFHELWGARMGRGRGFILHPKRDWAWAGGKWIELSTGREFMHFDYGSMKWLDFSPIPTLRSVWVGEHRVLEVLGSHFEKDAGAEPQTGRVLALWNLEAGRLETQAEAAHAHVLGVSPDGKWVVEGGSDKRVRIRDAATLRVEEEYRVHEKGVTGVAWHPSLPLIATASGDGTIRIWNRSPWRLEEEIRTGDSNACYVQIGADGKRLIAYRSNVWRILKTSVFEPGCFKK